MDVSFISEIIQTPNPYIFDKVSELNLTLVGIDTSVGGRGDYNWADLTTREQNICKPRFLTDPSCRLVPRSLEHSQHTFQVQYFNDAVKPFILITKTKVPIVQCK